MAGYVIGDCKEDEGVQIYVEVGRGGLVGGYERG